MKNVSKILLTTLIPLSSAICLSYAGLKAKEYPGFRGIISNYIPN